MIKFEMSEMKKFDDEMLEENYDFKLREWDESFESGVYKIEIGSRGLVEDVVKVEVVDGVFEVESVEEILNSMDEEDRESMREWVDVELNNGIVSKVIGDELCFDFVKLVID